MCMCVRVQTACTHKHVQKGQFMRLPFAKAPTSRSQSSPGEAWKRDLQRSVRPPRLPPPGTRFGQLVPLASPCFFASISCGQPKWSKAGIPLLRGIFGPFLKNDHHHPAEGRYARGLEWRTWIGRPSSRLKGSPGSVPCSRVKGCRGRGRKSERDGLLWLVVKR